MGNFFSPFGTFDFMFNLFPIMFLFVFAIVIYTFIKSIAESMHNKRQPVIPVETKIVSKRYNVSHHRHNTGNGHHHTSSSTYYYITFEMANGERMELRVPSHEFGMMAEGDTGTLQFQGTAFVSFVR